MVLRGQVGHSPQQIELIVAEITAIFIRAEDLIPLVSRQVSQLTVGLIDLTLAFCRHGFITLEQSLGLLLLRWSQVFKGLHTVQDLRLFVGRQIVEPVQAVDEFLLLIGWQAAEVGILAKLLLLLRRRLVPILAEPVAAVRPWAVQMELPSSLGIGTSGRRRITPLLPAGIGKAGQRS